MIRIVTGKKRISDLDTLFQKRLEKLFDYTIECWVSYPSGRFKDTVKYSDELDIWISHKKFNKLFNGFGIGRPKENRNNNLVGEINFPLKYIDRRVAGAFGEEENGNILLLHRGRIGGGKPGIGKIFFKDNFRGDFIFAFDGDRETEFCLVGELRSTYFPMQVSNFIKEINRVKNLSDKKEPTDFQYLNKFNFRDEHSGNSEKERIGSTTIHRTHGIIVNALASELENRKYHIGNDKNRDLFIHNNKKITTLFEIKTSTATQNLYEGVGQLIIYSIPIKIHVKLVLVIPKQLNETVTKRLMNLGIQILYFEWINKKPRFIELDKVIK